jgi:hypothetical protein
VDLVLIGLAVAIEPGSPWENGTIESFNGTLRDELLEREAFDTLLEAKVLIERWRQHYNTIRPHSALGYRPPAPEGWSIAGQNPSLRTGVIHDGELSASSTIFLPIVTNKSRQ